MENDVEATIDPSVTEATVRRKVDEKLGFREPFIRVPGYTSEATLVHGTPENNQFLTNAFNSQDGKRYFRDASAAIEYSTKYKQAQAQWEAKQQEILKQMEIAAGSPVLAALSAQLEKHQQFKPRQSGYGDYLASLGSTPNQIVTELVKRNDKATWYFEKYRALGIEKLLEQNDGLNDDPEGLARLMKANGYFDPQTDEEDFFIRNAKNPYALHFRHSVYGKIKGEYGLQMLASGFSPASLPFQMQAGRQLDPKDPKDQEAYIKFWNFSRSQEGHNWWINAGHAAAGIVQDFFGSIFKSAASLKPNGDNIEFEFDGDFIDPKGSNFELKQRFLRQWRELNSAYHQGRLGEHESLFYGYRKFIDKDKVVGSSSDIFDIYDPTSREEIPEQFKEFVRTYKQIKALGGIKYDVYGLSAAMSFIDGALQLTSGFGMMWSSTDPDSFLSASIPIGSRFWRSDEEMAKADRGLDFRTPMMEFPFSSDKSGKLQISQGDLEARIRFFNQAYRWHNKAEEWRNSGMIAPEALYDRELGNHAAGWADVSLLLGPGRAIAKAMFAKTGGRAIEALGLAAETSKKYMTTAFNIEEAVRKGVALPAELTDAIAAVMKESEAAGIKISEQDAIKKIFNGHPVIIDPKTGQKIAMPASQMISISRQVSASMDAMQKVRDALSVLANESRRTPKYSSATRRTMKDIRSWLIENEKSGIDWASLPTHEIWDMVAKKKIIIPGKVVGAARLEQMIAEVGQTWKNIDPHDIAGWKRTGQLPIELGFNPMSMVWRGLATTLSFVGNQSERFQEIARKYGPNETNTAVTVRNAAKLGQEQVGVGVAQAPWYKAWILFHSGPKVANLIGGAGDWLKHMNEYKEYASKLGGTKYGSALLAMASDALEEYKRLDALIEQALANKNFMSRADVQKLMNRRNEVFAKYNWAKNSHAWTDHAIGSGLIGTMVNGVVHGLYNEGLMYLADTREPGGMFGFTMGATPISRLIHQGLVRQVSPSASIEEKTNNSMVEFQGHLAQKFEGNDNQKARWIQLYMSQAAKAQEISIRLGEDAGKRYWAHSLEALNSLFRTGASVELHDSGFIEGRVAIMRDAALRETPGESDRILAEYTAEANRLGIEGDEAIEFANLKLDAYRRFNANQSRKVEISDKVAALEKESESLVSTTSKHLYRLEQAAKVMLKDLGFSPDKASISFENADLIARLEKEIETGKSGNTQLTPEEIAQRKKQLSEVEPKILLDGKPIIYPENLELRTKALDRINALFKEHRDLTLTRLKNEERIREIQKSIQALENELVTINSQDPQYTYRPGEVITDNVNGTKLTSYKDGITIWEQKDSDGKVGVKIILDRKKFNLETAWEEIIHALTYTENAQRGLVMFNSAFFGRWMQDPRNPGQYIQAMIDPETGKLVDAPPMISGDLDINIGLLETFANSYSDGLSTQEKAVFMAKFRNGVDRFRKNPTDLSGLEPTIAELLADVYKFRKALSSPFTSRGDWSPSTAFGTFEAGPNVVGIKSPRLWQKISSGQVTFADLAFEGRELNAKEIGLGLPIDQLTPEQDFIQRKMAAVGKFLRVFGFRGTYDVAIKNAAISKAFELGLHANRPDALDILNNTQTIFNTRQMWDADGNLIPVPEVMQRAVSTIINDTRGYGSAQIAELAFPSDETIEKNESSTNPADVEQRVRWAFSTGRKNWIAASGQFKRPWYELAHAEAEPMRDLFRLVIEDQKKNGNVYGLRVQRIGNGGYCVAGTPNLEQAKAVRDYLKERMLKAFQTDDVPNTYATIMTFMTSMADGNIFDPKASRPGKLVTYNGTYRPVWTASGSNVGSTRAHNRYRYGTERDMNFMPFGMIVADSSLDFMGEPMEVGKGKNKQQVSLPTVYFWALDLDNFALRRQLAMRGELRDSKNGTYFEKGELLQLFGTFDKFDEAFRVAMANWANSGSFEKGVKEFQVPERTWKALLPLTENSKGKTNQKLAESWAFAIQRIIGFPTNQFKELTLIERELLTNKVGDREMTATERAERKAMVKILRGKEVAAKTESELALAKAGASVGRNPLGEAASLDTKESAFMLIRADRFAGVPTPILDQTTGNPITMSFSNWGSLAGGINWSTNNWSAMPSENVRKELASFNMGNKMAYAAWKHDSGYKVYLMAERDEKTNTWGSSSYVVFDPQRNVVNQFRVNDLNQAFQVASQHSENNPQQPIIGNTFEASMIEEGWLPKGNNIVGRMRDRFVSGTGEWMIQREDRGDAFKLVHIPTGFTIARRLSVYSVDQKETKVDLKDVNAAIQDAVENNTIHVRTRKEAHAKLEQLGLAEWHMVPEVDTATGGVKNRRALVFEDTPEYYNFKRLLTYGTPEYAGLGHAFAKQVTDMMKAELGADVIAKDRQAVMQWIEKWGKEFSQEQIDNIARDTIKLFDESKEKQENEKAQQLLLQAGQQLIFNKPKKPTKATMVDSEGKVPPEWLDDKGQLRAEIVKAFMDRYAEEAAAWDMDERRRRGIQPGEFEELDYAGRPVMTYNQLVSFIQGSRQRFETWAQEQAKNKPVGQVTNLESEDIIKKIAALRTSGLEAQEAAKSKWLVNNFGYMIQGMFYKEPKPPLGIEFSIGRIGLFSNRLYEGSNYIFQKPSELPKTKFVVYSPNGVIIGQYKSIEEANEAALDHEMNRTAEDNKREQQLKTMLNPQQSTKPTENIYRKWLERHLTR